MFVQRIAFLGTGIVSFFARFGAFGGTYARCAVGG